MLVIRWLRITRNNRGVEKRPKNKSVTLAKGGGKVKLGPLTRSAGKPFSRIKGLENEDVFYNVYTISFFWV